DVQIAVEVDPERRAGESDVADGVARELGTGGGILQRRRVPAERPRGRPDRVVAPPELAGEARWAGDGLSEARIAGGSRDAVEVTGAREEPSMAGDAAHRVGVVVVHLAAQHALSPRAALGRGDHLGDRLELARPQHREIDERGRAQSERLEDLFLTVTVQ